MVWLWARRKLLDTYEQATCEIDIKDLFELPYDQLSPGIVGAIERAAYSAGQTLVRFSLFRDLRRSRGPAKEQ